MPRMTLILLAFVALAACDATMTSNASGEIEQQQAAGSGQGGATGDEWWAN